MPDKPTADWIDNNRRSLANHLGVTIEADIIEQKLPENNNGHGALNQNGVTYGHTSKLAYSQLTSATPDRPVPISGRQLLAAVTPV
ncbi:MAG: hypothetical protein ACYDAB_17865 [bacterium]